MLLPLTGLRKLIDSVFSSLRVDYVNASLRFAGSGRLDNDFEVKCCKLYDRVLKCEASND